MNEIDDIIIKFTGGNELYFVKENDSEEWRMVNKKTENSGMLHSELMKPLLDFIKLTAFLSKDHSETEKDK